MVVVVVCACLLPGAPPTSPYPFYPTLIPYLPTPDPPDSPPVGCVTFVRGRLRACSGRERCFDLWRLAEFQTPTIFNHNFDFSCSIFYSCPKIMNMIICVLYIHQNVFPILLQEILICRIGYMVISFQSC